MNEIKDNATNPLVSVVIPTFNRSEFLKEAISSVMKQDHRPLELVVVDDASTDGTADTIRSIRDELDQKNITFRYFQNWQNIGCGASIAEGFHEAKGDYLSYLADDDILVLHNKISRQVAAMEAADAVWSYYRDSWVGPDMFHAEPVQPSYIPRMRFLNPIFEQRPLLRFLALQKRNPINSSTLMIRGEAYRDHGGWVEWTRNADCDGYLLMKYSLLRLPCVVLPGAPVFYRVHEAQVSNRMTMAPGKALTRKRAIEDARNMEFPAWFKFLLRFYP